MKINWRRAINKKNNNSLVIAGMIVYGLAAYFYVARSISWAVALSRVYIAVALVYPFWHVLKYGIRETLKKIEKYKREFVIYGIAVAALGIYQHCFIYLLRGKDQLYAQVRSAFTASVIFLIAVIFFLAYKKKWKLQNLYLICAIFFCSIACIITPVYGKPDEEVHFLTAYSISNKILGVENGNNGTVSMRESDTEYGYTILSGENFEIQYENYLKGLVRKPHNLQIVHTNKYPLKTSIYEHIIPALGITLGRIAKLSTEATFTLARFFNAVLFVVLSYLSICILPIGQPLFMIIALMPMTIQQVSSASYDALLISLSFVIISLVMRFWKAPPQSDKKIMEGGIVLGAACLLLLPMKAHAYFLLSFFPVLLTLKYIKTNKKITLLACTIIILCILQLIGGYIWPEFMQVGVKNGPAVGSAVLQKGDELYSIKGLLADGAELYKVIYNTLMTFGSFYVESTIGNPLGWLSISISPLIIYAYIVMLAFSIIPEQNEKFSLGWHGRLVLFGIGFLGIVILIGAMLISYTPASHHRVEGVQGRYFIPFLFPLLLSFRSNRVKVEKTIDKELLLGVVICLFFTIRYTLP